MTPPVVTPRWSRYTVAATVVLVALVGFALADLFTLRSLKTTELLALHSVFDMNYAGLSLSIPPDEVVDFVDNGDWDKGTYLQCQFAIAPVRIDYHDYTEHRLTHPYVIAILAPGSAGQRAMTARREYHAVKTFAPDITLYHRR